MYPITSHRALHHHVAHVTVKIKNKCCCFVERTKCFTPTLSDTQTDDSNHDYENISHLLSLILPELFMSQDGFYTKHFTSIHPYSFTNHIFISNIDCIMPGINRANKVILTFYWCCIDRGEQSPSSPHTILCKTALQECVLWKELDKCCVASVMI